MPGAVHALMHTRSYRQSKGHQPQQKETLAAPRPSRRWQLCVWKISRARNEDDEGRESGLLLLFFPQGVQLFNNLEEEEGVSMYR